MNDSKIVRRDIKPALVFLSGELIAVPIPLERQEVIMGRALEADVRVNDTQVSRKHAMVTADTSTEKVQYILTDLDSRNGTFLNGRRVRHEVLENGDKISIGETILRFDLLDEIDREYQRQIHRLISHLRLPLGPGQQAGRPMAGHESRASIAHKERVGGRG